LHTPAYADPPRLWPLSVVAIAALVALLQRATPARAAWLGLAFGSGWLGAGVWWLFVSMHRYGGLPAWMAAAAVAALSMALSLYLAVACAAWARWRPGRPLADALLLAALWLLAELARGLLFTGFPWVASGYALVDAPLAALAPWVGVYGIGALLAFAAALLGGISGCRGRARAGVLLGAAAVLLAPLALPGSGFTEPAGRISVSLLQTDVAQEEKFRPARTPELLQALGEQLRGARGQLVVAPETAVPLLPARLAALAPQWWAEHLEPIARSGRAALVGVPLGDFDEGYTNSVAGLAAGAAYRYDKHHLVPFGEFIPRGFRWFTERMDIPLGDFSRGPLRAPAFAALGQRLGPNVCYEDLFGEELAARFTDPAQAPTVLVNLSNIAWFGDTVALPQHLHITRMRTLELERPMLRATNTGVTAIVDHRGRVVDRLPPFAAGVLEGEVEGRKGLTPYARWAGAWGLWPLAVAALAVIALVVLAGRGGRARAAP
ncbi:MAG: apolipoprotein N-acyltransferase, partial [Rubrivivax sp.]